MPDLPHVYDEHGVAWPAKCTCGGVIGKPCPDCNPIDPDALCPPIEEHAMTATRHGHTAHGHHCCEQAPVGERPNRVARCGGPSLCRDCQRSAAEIHGTTTVADHPETTCGRCGGPNIAWSAPSPLWNEVMRGGDINATDTEPHHGIVCPTCFAVLAQQAGIADLWQLSAKRVHVPLQTVTPSGRTWNEQTWLWDDEAAPGGPGRGETDEQTARKPLITTKRPPRNPGDDTHSLDTSGETDEQAGGAA